MEGTNRKVGVSLTNQLGPTPLVERLDNRLDFSRKSAGMALMLLTPFHGFRLLNQFCDVRFCELLELLKCRIREFLLSRTFTDQLIRAVLHTETKNKRKGRAICCGNNDQVLVVRTAIDKPRSIAKIFLKRAYIALPRFCCGCIA